MTTRVYVLLGGFVGPDGWADSLPMYNLERRIVSTFPGVVGRVFAWSSWEVAAADIKQSSSSDKVIVIGYSGGGSRATWLANGIGGRSIDLMVLYDPSPSWQMLRIKNNVKRAICYYNKMPLFFDLGGGRLVGPNVTLEVIAEEHAFVQSDGRLHARTIEEIRKVLA